MRVLKRVILVSVAILLAWLAWEWITFPDVAALADAPPETTAFMERRREELREAGKDDTLSWQWVPYSRISPHLRRGVLVAEDNSFYEHEGVDVKGMREALERNLKRRKLTHGGSTITQQLAKNLYLSPSRNPLRKLREYFIARSLEKHLSKKRILEIYLNVVEMGERVYGAEAASRFYFDRSAASLSPSQAALLAGCLPNPRVMNPGDPNKRLRARQNMILSRMRRWGAAVETEVLTEKKPEPKKEEAEEAPPVESGTTLTDEVPAPTETGDTSGTTDTSGSVVPEDTPAEEIAPTDTSTTTSGETIAPPPTNT
jgi:monofunctional biosynthetic peptidoglycan transglycosylase